MDTKDINATSEDTLPQDQNGGIDWDASISAGAPVSRIIPEGDYNYTVIDYMRGRYPGGPKLSACNKASLTLAVDTDEGPALVYDVLYLHESVEWKLSAFFRSIGFKAVNGMITMNWDKVPGTRGRAHFKVSTYTDKTGNKRQSNEVARYIDYDPAFFSADSDTGEDAELPF